MLGVRMLGRRRLLIIRNLYRPFEALERRAQRQSHSPYRRREKRDEAAYVGTASPFNCEDELRLFSLTPRVRRVLKAQYYPDREENGIGGRSRGALTDRFPLRLRRAIMSEKKRQKRTKGFMK